MIPPCSCGEPHPHTVARRQTADRIDVILDSDGALAGWGSYRIVGLPSRPPRTEATYALRMRAAWLLLGEVCVHTRAELPDLWAACEQAARGDGLPGTVRRLFAEAERAEADRPRLSPRWEILHTDRDGEPTEKVWVLPRLLGLGRLALWYDRGTYGLYEWRRPMEIAYGIVEGPRPAWAPTGWKWRRLRDALAHLDGLRGEA